MLLRTQALKLTEGSNDLIYLTIISKQPTPDVPVSFRGLMDESGILIANLAKGRLGSDSADTLGSMIVATIALAALSRAEELVPDRRPFFLYVDEFQSFTMRAFAAMMPELRKYGVALTLANQYLFQLGDEVRKSVLGSVGTLISFRLGPEDAVLISREFQPTIGGSIALPWTGMTRRCPAPISPA